MNVSPRVRAVIYGTALGTVLAIAGLVTFGSRTSLGSVDGILLDPSTGRGRADFVISSGGLYSAVIILAILGGMATAALVYAFSRENDPAATRFPLRFLLPAAGFTAALIAYATLRAGIGASGSIAGGTVMMSAFRMVITIGIVGSLAGAVTASIVDALARPSFVGFGDEPATHGAPSAMKEMMGAIGPPTIAVIVIATIAIGFSQVLLKLGTFGSVAAFSMVGTLILIGAVLAAYRPWERG